ncbi:DNA-dependent ATPase [Saccharomycopsis crataegensis]|uniref:DNA helicase n=1 Tax=Saccharomycopsis crataegensis TaxID=43959 RepID=A0AAV5QUG6_9ASCO|nr:DNA-dependent ATPase [Saccharomycopsis crataegensis]
MSDDQISPNKPFVQVPASTESSPLKTSEFVNMPPSRTLTDGSLNSTNNDDYQMLSKSKFSEKSSLSNLKSFAYQGGSTANPVVNGSNGITADQTNSNGLPKQMEDNMNILKKRYPTCKESVLLQTYKKKKGNLREVIGFLNGLQVSHPQFFKATNPPSNNNISSRQKETAKPVTHNSPGATRPSGRLASLNSTPQKSELSYKLNPTKKVLSIQQKFGLSSQIKSEAPQVKKRRLVRGSRNPKPDYQEDDFIADDDEDDEEVAKIKKPKSILEKYAANQKAIINRAVSLSDDEEADAGASEDEDDSDAGEYYTQSAASQYEMNNRLLEFLNTAELGDICDIGGCSPAIAENLIKNRPWRSLYDLENNELGETVETQSRRSKRKPNGLKIVEKAAVTLRGYDAVESLVQKCSQYGNIISNEIKKWGINVAGEKGELEITEVDSEEVNDDNNNNNQEEEGEDGDNDIGSTQRKVRGTYFSHKPKWAADNLQLKPYQQVGINWLNLLYQNNLSCILADEMGLGKTCQVISFFAYLKEISSNKGPNLVIVPSSTLENWLREFQKFCPTLKVSPYYGSQKERFELRMTLEETEFDVLVTTYNLATGNKDDMKFLRSRKFNIIVYDEGHMLKNSNSERYQKLMKIPGKFRLLLTGTPLQNNLKELISLLAFILPNLFREKQQDLQVLFNQKATTSSKDDGSRKDFNPLLSVRAISRAKTMMTPFVLRRKKQQVLKNMPKKETFIEYCDNTDIQQDLYEKQLEKGRKATEESSELDKNRDQSSNIIMSLRKASIHPLLFRIHFTEPLLRKMAKDIMKEPQYRDANVQFIFEDMEVMTDFELHNLCLKFPKTIGKYKLDLSEEILNSGKFMKLKELLPNFIIQGDRILIFSLFTQVLDILEILLNELSIKFLRLDGSTSVELRQDIIDQFYQDESIKVFILSTKAGGFGINLACANTVVILDQSFNPHDDRQAEDRAHRVGQTREVRVYRMISQNTIEENIYNLAQQKLALDQSVSGDGDNSDAASNKNEEKASKSLFKELFK